MKNKLIFICFIILFYNSCHCTNNFFKVEKQQLSLNNAQFLKFKNLQDQKNLEVQIIDTKQMILDQDIQLIDNKFAISTKTLKDMYGISLLNQSCSGLCTFEFDLYISKSSKLDRTLFLYSSNGVNERDTPIYLDLTKLKRGQWVKLNLWMPRYLPRGGDGPDLQITNPTRFKREDLNSPLSPKSRRAMTGLKDLTNLDGVYIHSISLKKSNLNLLNYDEKSIIQKAISLYPSHFEKPISLSILIVFFIGFFISFLIQLKRKLGHKILLGFIIPISFAIIFLASQGVNDILASVETSELYKVQKGLQEDIFKINAIGEVIESTFSQNLDQEIIPKIRESISYLRNNNISLASNPYAKASSKVMYRDNPDQFLMQFSVKDSMDLQLKTIIAPYNMNLMIANDNTIFYSNHYYLDKGMRHLTTILQKYIQNELKIEPNKNGRQQIESIREMISNFLNNSKTFDQFINSPSLPVRLQKHSIEDETSSNTIFWSYFIEKYKGKDLVWLMFGGIEKQAVRSNLAKHLSKFVALKQHSFDDFLFLGDNLLGTISNNDSLDNDLLEVSSYAKNNRSLSFFPKLRDEKLYFYSYHMYEPSMLYSFVLRKSGDNYLLKIQSTKNYIYYSIYLLFALILLCSHLLSKLVTRPMFRLSQGMLKIEQEQFKDDLYHSGKDQFSEVSQLLNHVLISLREKEHLSKFLSNMVLNSLDSQQLSSSRQDQYILFCGIQNLKDLEKEIKLEKVINLIDLFLQSVQKLIVKYNGRIDKFTGKSSLSIFDSKLDPRDLIQLLIDLKTELSNFAIVNKTNIKFGAGLAKGSVVLGHVGSQQRKDFTAIGSTVNKAARLEALASKTEDQTNIYVDQVCFNIFKDYEHFQYKLCESVHLKGYKEEQSVYELL